MEVLLARDGAETPFERINAQDFKREKGSAGIEVPLLIRSQMPVDVEILFSVGQSIGDDAIWGRG